MSWGRPRSSVPSARLTRVRNTRASSSSAAVPESSASAGLAAASRWARTTIWRGESPGRMPSTVSTSASPSIVRPVVVLRRTCMPAARNDARDAVGQRAVAPRAGPAVAGTPRRARSGCRARARRPMRARGRRRRRPRGSGPATAGSGARRRRRRPRPAPGGTPFYKRAGPARLCTVSTILRYAGTCTAHPAGRRRAADPDAAVLPAAARRLRGRAGLGRPRGARALLRADLRPRRARRDAAQDGRPGGVPPAARALLRPDHHAHREVRGDRQGPRAWSSARTTTSPSRSPCASSARG